MVKRVVQMCCMAAGISVMPMLGAAIAVDGVYHSFYFAGAPSFAGSCGGTCSPTTNPVADQSIDPPWSFTGASNVLVLDFGHAGDRFELYDSTTGNLADEVLIGATSSLGGANTGIDTCGLDITCSRGNPLYSQGTFALGSGNHSLRIRVIQNALNTVEGNAVFSASGVSAVPEPATVSLLGAGLLVVGLFRKRRDKL